MHEKKKNRMERIAGARARMRTTAGYRLCVNRTSRHIYAQIIVADGSRTVASASSLDKEVRKLGKEMDKTGVASKVGELIAKRALEKSVERAAFDRSGFFYHGRVKALAEAVRENGLKI